MRPSEARRAATVTTANGPSETVPLPSKNNSSHATKHNGKLQTGGQPKPAEHRVQIVSAKRIDDRGRPSGIGQWFVEYSGRVIGEFANPEADAAKHLLDNGLASRADTLHTYRGDQRSMTGNVGKFAGAAQKPPSSWKDGKVEAGLPPEW